MARQAGIHRLTARFVATVKEPGFYPDGAGLSLVVSNSGSVWRQKVTIRGGKRLTLGLGRCRDKGLAAARKEAARNREAAARGLDPREANKPAAEIPTLREMAEDTYQGLQSQWTNPKHRKQWVCSLHKYVLDVQLSGHRQKMGERLVSEITPPDVIECLQRIWTTTPETARRTRQRLRKVLDVATAFGHRQGDNPAGRCIDAALPPQHHQKKHLRALPYQELSEALVTIRNGRATDVVKNMVEFVILTAARNGEVRGALWNEIDFDTATWTIPSSRMKTRKEHRVPLSSRAVEILLSMKDYQTGVDSFVFPSPRNCTKPISDMSATKVLRDCELADRTTVHGFRSSFRNWCAERGTPREVAEAALSHTVKGVEGAYFRSDLFDLRRVLMQAWDTFLNDSHNDGNVLRGDFRRTA